MDLFRLAPGAERRLRWLLFGGLAGAAALLVVGGLVLDREAPELAEDTSWYGTDFEAEPAVRLLQEYVGIDTSQETGSELAGALWLADRLAEIGLEPQVERLGERKANLWAVLEGEEPRALVLHHHIDVYPVRDPGAWTSPPFEGTVQPPWIYGRGVFDMKSVAIAQLEALRALARQGRPRRSVVFLATGSEEVGSELGTRWILDRHPELAGRFWAVLTEGGVVEAVTQREVKYWGVETGQKRFAEGWLCAAERERLVDLRREILEWGAAVAEWRLHPEVETFLASYAPSRTHRDYREFLAHTWAALHDPEVLLSLPPFLQSMFRSEMVPFEPEEDPAGGWRMRLLLHLLPGDDPVAVRRRLLPPWLTHGVALQLGEPLGAATGSPVDHPLFETVVEVVRGSFPDTRIGPYFQPWSANDSRFFRAAGIPSYGFSPFVIFSSDTFRKDASNERLALPGYLDGVELYRRVVARAAG